MVIFPQWVHDSSTKATQVCLTSVNETNVFFLNRYLENIAQLCNENQALSVPTGSLLSYLE